MFSTPFGLQPVRAKRQLEDRDSIESCEATQSMKLRAVVGDEERENDLLTIAALTVDLERVH
jgi:hypothetical protein